MQCLKSFLLLVTAFFLFVGCNKATQGVAAQSSADFDSTFVLDGVDYKLLVFSHPDAVDVVLYKEHFLLVQEHFSPNQIAGDGAIMEKPAYSLSSDSLIVILNAINNGKALSSRQSWSLCRYTELMRKDFVNDIKNLSNPLCIDSFFAYNEDSFYVSCCLIPRDSVVISSEHYTSDLVSSDFVVANRDLFFSLYKNGSLVDSVYICKHSLDSLDLPIADDFNFQSSLDLVGYDGSIDYFE